MSSVETIEPPDAEEDIETTPQENEVEPLMTISEVAFNDMLPPEDVVITDDEIRLANPPATTPYDKWKADPSTDNLADVLDSLKYTINASVASLGGVGNPQIMSRARVTAAKAIKNYDPSYGAGLPTWVSQQLRQLSRDIRKSNNTLSVADGVQLDGYRLYQAENEFQDENGREPTLEELADLTHLSKKRIRDIRKKLKSVVAEGGTVTEAGDSMVSSVQSDYSKDAMDYVYKEADTTDKKLLEYMTGYGGEDILDNKAIMSKLKLTPVQLSRRKARLSLKINKIVSDLEQVNG